MNYTNFATDKPAVKKEPSASTFESGRDIAYLVFSILQFGITVFTLILVHHIIRKKDKKDEKERLKKEERDKIADIINNEYRKIVDNGIDVNLKKCKEKFEDMVMFYGTVSETRNKITGLDVLRFMLLNPNDLKGNLLRKLKEDLDAVQKLFLSLRLKLPLKGDCPINIKEELGPLITGVGEIARSFVSAKKRYTISIVLKYFGNVQANVRSIDDEEKEDKENNKEIRMILPYVNGVSLGETRPQGSNGPSTYHDKDFSFDIPIRFVGEPKQSYFISELQCLKVKLCNIQKTIKAEVLQSFALEINSIWSRKFQQLRMPDWDTREHLRANILHAVYVFWAKVAKGSDIIQDQQFDKLVAEMSNITKVQDSEMQMRISEGLIQHIQFALDLLKSNDHYEFVCEQKSFADMLQQVYQNINDIFAQASRKPI